MIKTLKNLEVLNILSGLQNSDIKTKQMTVPFLWALKVNMNKLTEVSTMYDESRKTLCDNYSTDDKSFIESDENGNEMRKIKPEYQNDWINDNNELLNQETEFDFKTVDVESLSNVTMSPAEFELLSQFMFDI